MGRPQCVVIGGPNGAGKTSAAPDLLHDTVGIDAFINADVIAQGLAGFDPGSVAFEAGRVMIRRIHELGAAREHFAIESTLSGKSAVRLLKDLRGIGYDVHVLYFWLPSPDLSVARVRQRVLAGGHDVPEPVVRRRFLKSLGNFMHVYQPVATVWRTYDSSIIGQRPVIAEGGVDAPDRIVDAGAWNSMLTLAGNAA